MLTITIQPGEHALGLAIASLPAGDEPACIRMAPGVYEEKVVLARPNTTLQGAGAAQTTITWHDAATQILPDGTKRGTFRTSTLRVDAPDVTLRNLTVQNSAVPREKTGQCIALYADGDRFLCEDCVMLSHQDTLFTAPLPPKEVIKDGFIGPKQFAPRTPQRQTYRRCRIEGDVDFIFGGAAAWFEDCEIVAADGRQDRSTPFVAYCTAASTPQGQRFGYVFKHCRFTSRNFPQGTVYLGRPWREYAKTVLIDCELGDHIKPEGWHDWDKPVFHRMGYYGEYASRGPGANGERAPYAHALTDREAQAITYEAFMADMA